MTYLTQHLGFSDSASSGSSSQALPPEGTHLLITDTLDSPGHFATYHVVSAAIQAKRKVIWVDFRNEGRQSWESVLKKLGTPLPITSSSGFVHIAPSSLGFSISSSTPGSTLSPQLFEDDKPNLRATYTTIASNISALQKGTNSTSVEESIVILDGLAELLWIGFTPTLVAQFVRATLALSRQTNSSLVSTLHADHLPLTPTSPQSIASPAADLLGRLIRLGGGGWWRVSNLSSGRSGDVHGEISSHPLYPALSGSFPDIPKDHPLQYRLEASTVKVFPKGTGRGFL